MERERGMVRQPPAKRMKLAAAAVPAGVGVGSGGGEVASPRSRVTLRQTLLMVLFLVRARNTVTASISQIGRMLQRYVDRTFHKYHVMISSKLDGFQEQIEGLRHEVTCLSRLYSNRHADQQTRLEGNQEHVTANGSNPNIRLCFRDGLKPSVYTDENLTSENDAAIKLAMFEGDKVVTSGALSQAKVEILILRGDFSNKCRDNWTEEEFEKYIVQGREGHDLVLGTVWLTNGEVELSQIHFKEGSCRRNVIMAARVCKSEKIFGRIQEAIMKNPVRVLDRRNKPNEKRHPPGLDDDLYRLEEIARDGVYHKRLRQAKIYKVEGLLKALNEDSNKLRGILKMEKQQNAWSKLTEHARECVLEDKQELKRYQNEEGTVVLFFNCVHDVVGAAFPREYVACQRCDLAQKVTQISQEPPRTRVCLAAPPHMMAYALLKHVTPQSQQWTVKGRITRFSEFVSTDQPPKVLRLDFVVLDEEGTAMDGQVPKACLSKFTPLLKEECLYIIRNFFVTAPRSKFRPVSHPYLMKFTTHTKISEVKPIPEKFPKYACAITSFKDLEARADIKEYCSDIIGIFKGSTQVRMQDNARGATALRNIQVSDGSQQIDIALWGRQAELFDAELYMKMSAEQPLILLFVGMTCARFNANLSLQGSSFCRWYCNPELPEVAALRIHHSADGIVILNFLK